MRRALLVLLLMSACGLAPTAAASAHAIVHVSGTDLGPDAGTTSCHPINPAGSLLSCDTPDFATRYTGDLAGTIRTDFKWVINCSPSVIDGQGAETFTGSVARVGSGTLRWDTKFHAAFDCSTQTLSNLHGTGTILSGTGALAGMRGTLIFTDQQYSGILLRRPVHAVRHRGNTYSYRYRFTPSHRSDVGAVAAAATARTAHTASSPANQVRAAERTLLRATVAHNTRAAGALLAPDFQGIDVTGTAETRADNLANIGGAIDFVKADPVSPIRVRVHGNSAVARVKLAFKVVAGGQTVEHGAWTTDVFERRNGNWQVVWEQTTAIPNNLGLFLQSLMPQP